MKIVIYDREWNFDDEKWIQTAYEVFIIPTAGGRADWGNVRIKNLGYSKALRFVDNK